MVKQTQFKITDNSGRTAEIDEITHSLAFIDYPHHEIHEGDMFGLAAEADLASTGDVKDFLIITPSNGKQMHILWEMSGDDKFKFYFYKNPTVSSNGTDVTSDVFNHNQNSANTTSATLYDSPTVTSVGTLLFEGYTDKFVPIRAMHEFILGESDTYLFRIEALKNTAVIAVHGVWYEHTPKE